MNAHHRGEVSLAAGLACIAGFVDAVAYVHLGGYFVSFMSGNSTRGGVELAHGSLHGWALAVGLVAAFVFGVICGSVLTHVVREHQRAAVLVLVAFTLMLAALTGTSASLGFAAPPLMALAMGAENAVFQKGGEVTIGVTYMTGNLVKMAQKFVAGFFGGARWVWLRYCALWMAMASGALLGALSYGWIAMFSLWIAAGVTVLSVVVSRVYVH
ncbi:MAG: YoaK family protein [Microbacteriaceae bacterium]